MRNTVDNRPIGFFDSGIGGLTAVGALKELLPDENIVYFGDTGRCPYGTKSPAELRIMARQNLEYLASFSCKAIIAACGTVSANCRDILDLFEIPVFNVLMPSAKRMAETEGNEPLAVIATDASIRSGAFQKQISEMCTGQREILGIPCQDFVALSESGHTERDDPFLTEAVRRYLGPAKGKNISAILLGCTHFGIIADAISDFMGKETKLVSASECAAEALTAYLKKNHLEGRGAVSRYFTSGDTEIFDKMAPVILGNKYDTEAVFVPPMKIE